MSRCISCIDSLTCQTCTDLTLMDPNNNCQCISGYVLTSSSTCVLCSSIIPYCDSCDSTTKTCSHCVDPYYNPSTTLCSACPLECKSCTNYTYCTACITGFDLVLSSSVPGPPTLNDLQSCQCISLDCFTTCPSRFPTLPCTSCDLTNCLSCGIGYFWTPYTCTICPFKCTNCNDTSCITCAPTFTVINGVCACNDVVQLYYNSNSNTCTSCGSIDLACPNCCTSCKNVLTPSLPQPTICLSCITGYYPVSNSINCLVCPSTCTACTDAATCTSCKPTYLILPGTTMCACDTGAQYFSNPPNGCQLCSNIIPHCTNCTLNPTLTCT